MTPDGQVDLLEQAGDFVLVFGRFRADPALLLPGPPLLTLRTADGASRIWPLLRLKPLDSPFSQGFQIMRGPTPPDGPMPSGPFTVSVALGDHQVALGDGAIFPQPFRARGELDLPDRKGVAGWVLDLPGVVPTLLVDGRINVPVPLDRPRQDLPFDMGEADRCLGFQISLTKLGEALRAAEPGFTLLDGEQHSITLLSGEAELGRHTLHQPRTTRGKLERIVDGQAIGWATEAEPLQRTVSVELLLDGTRWHTMPAATPRGDLAANGVGTRLTGGAFRADLPTRSPSGAAEVVVELRPAHGRTPLPGTTTLNGMAPWRPDHGGLLDTLPPGGLPAVSIIVPIHNAAEDLALCVAAVLRHTTGRTRLLLIDDASTDPAIARLFDQWEGKPGIELHRQTANLGFTATCNRGFALAGQDDVVLLNSDTQVGPGWLDGLRLAAHATSRVGTVTAVSNNAGVFSVPELDVDNRPPAWFSVADMARLVRQAALAVWPSAPTGNGFCLYIRRACLDAVGGLDEAAFPRGYGEENDFCMRAAAAGFEHKVDDRTWVWHRRSASFGSAKSAHMAAGQAVLAERYPEYRMLTGVFREDPSFLGLRWRVRRALERALAGGERPRPRVLFVISTESGGTPQTNRDLMRALADRYEPWVLRCTGRTIELIPDRATEPTEICHLERPINPATHGSAEYDRCVAALLLRYGFELVHIRHIAWHGIGLPRVCQTLGIPVVFSFHDFYTLCPTTKLLDAEGRFCGGRCTQGEGDCVAELWPASAVPPLRGRFVYRWRAAMAAAIDACDAFVTTSPKAQQIMTEGLPSLAGRDFRVIPHGRDFARLLSLTAEASPEEPLRVLVPGNISTAKGAAIVAAMAALDRGHEIEFHVLGAVDGNLDTPRPGVVLHGRYERERFAEHVAMINPHLAVILSTWPETYCHTLTECWSIGLPVLGTAIGAVQERIEADGGGWLVDPTTAPEAILDLLLGLKEDTDALRARREEVRRWQRRTGRHYDTAAMATAYDLLYREVLERRRSFAAAQPATTPLVALAVIGDADPATFHLALPVHNDVSRDVIYRSVSRTYPFGDAAAGLADVVLTEEAALRPRDLASMAEQCQTAGLPLLVETDALPSGAPGRTVLAAAGAGFLAPTALAASALRRGGYAVEVLPGFLDPVRWLPPVVTSRDVQPRRATCRLLGFADDPGLDMLHVTLSDLRALDVADHVLVGAGGLALGPDPVAGLRAIAGTCDLAIFPLAVAADEPRALALMAAGLVLLRNRVAGEELGETADGQLILPANPDAWLRAIAELSADAPRRAAMARRTRRAMAALMSNPTAPLDKALRQAAGPVDLALAGC